MKNAGTLIAVGIALASMMLLPGVSISQNSTIQGYGVDTYGSNISTSPNTDICWRTSDWTPARAIAVCDPVTENAIAPVRVVADAAAAFPEIGASTRTEKPATMMPQSISFSADALFDFDKSVLKPEGKTSLVGFARQLNSAQYEAIFVSGHTDRFGSREYNLSLSVHRANAVKNYLVSKAVPANRINADGKGETHPITRADDCKGVQSVEVIACQQPDRRVHVEVRSGQGL